MDRIEVSTNALILADNVLKELTDSISITIAQCKSKIKDEFHGIDINLQNDLIEYLNQLELFENKLLSFKSENSRAIYERITRISEYSETTYKARNINGEV